MTLTTDLPFYKMHGLGNDFIILDNRDNRLYRMNSRYVVWQTGIRVWVVIRLWSYGHPTRQAPFGLICLMLMAVRRACGNGTRCVARLVMDQAGRDVIGIETVAGYLKSWRTDAKSDIISADMGPVSLDWRDIPAGLWTR